GAGAGMKPKKLTSKRDREAARWTRDRQWEFMERVAKHGTLWFCVWNKYGRPEAEDEWRDGLLTGMDILDWMKRHRDWFVIGRWNDGRYAQPIKLKPPGRRALQNRHLYDMEPIHGGLV